jgi:hypothetical protein
MISNVSTNCEKLKKKKGEINENANARCSPPAKK